MAILITLVVFAGLWSAPWHWRPRTPGGVQAPGSPSWLLTLYAISFLAAAWWWRVPLQAEKLVTEFAYQSDSSAMGIGCPEVTAAARKFERASSGELDFVDDGSVLVRASVWRSMDAQQQTMFTGLAEKVSACAGLKGKTMVKDILTGAVLNEDPSGV